MSETNMNETPEPETTETAAGGGSSAAPGSASDVERLEWLEEYLIRLTMYRATHTVHMDGTTCSGQFCIDGKMQPSVKGRSLRDLVDRSMDAYLAEPRITEPNTERSQPSPANER